MTFEIMKTNLEKLVFILLTFSILISCRSEVELKPVQTTSKPVFITGKALNQTSEYNTVTVYVNELLSGEQLSYVSLVDSFGNFQIKFKLYYPQDILVRYGDNAFPIIIHPTDSIHIVFDANMISDKNELAKSIQVAGSRSDNESLIAFYALISEIFIPWEQYCQYEKEYNSDEFTALLDSLRNLKKEVASEFIRQGVSKEIENWIKNEVDFDYYIWLARYPHDHAGFNQLDEYTIVPSSFYDFMNIELSLNDLINSKSIDFIGRYRFGRISVLLIDEGKLYKRNERWTYKANANKAIISTIIKNTSDTLLKEILIARELYKMLEMRDIKEFESHHSLFKEIVKQPFLREPLINKYVETKEHFENAQQRENTLLKLTKNTPANELITKILDDHKGKIIYLDIWATWCSPCRREMPFSKELMQTLDSDKIAFIYLCIDSDKDKWKAIISELDISGSHYFATPDQSRFLYQLFEMNGVPQYVLLDTKGNVIEKGIQLRPSESLIKTKIDKLLME